MALPLYYNWRNLLARKLSTALTFFIVAVVVFVLALLLSFASGIQASLVASGSRHNIIVLKPGSTAESTSLITTDEVARVIQVPGVARGVAGEALISQELALQTLIERRTNGLPANVAVRGVDEVAFEVHDEVRVTSGRRFEPGAMEVIVGRAAQERFRGLEVGNEVNLGRKSDRKYRVVGTFTAGGGAFESEIWAPRTMMLDSYQRRLASSVCIRLTSPDAAPAAIQFIRGPSVDLEAKVESQYYEELAAKTREIVVLTTVLVAIMAVGAAFAVANTLYSAVDGRRRELAMLRAIGFGRGSIMAALLVESLLLCTIACGSGLAASLLFDGARQDFLSDATWTVLAYELRITPQIMASALALAVLVGVTGALAPAARAARIDVLQALRKA